MSYKYNVLQFRVSEEDKEKLRSYAAKHNKTMSEVVRELCSLLFKEEENNVTEF